MADFGGARRWAQAIVTAAIGEGSRVVDATMGNGHDTLWLAQSVGETGRVIAFDVQQAAIDKTRERLSAEGLSGRAELILGGHERMGEFVTESVDAIVFNLGWLPGTPHQCTTKVETTLRAVASAARLIKPGGVVTICVYPGHEEGLKEREALIDWARGLDDGVFDAIVCGYANIRKLPPLLIAVTKREKGT